MTDDARERILAFERQFEERCAGRIEETSFGRAYLHLGFPFRYSSNFVWVDRPLDGVEADALAADADRVLGEHDGFRHRKIQIDDERHGARLAGSFLELGWSVQRDVFMVHARKPEPRPEVDVIETDFVTAGPVIAEVMQEQPYVDSDDVQRQLVDFREVLERQVGARFFVAMVDGEPAAVCEAYVLGDVGQVEDVNTLEGFRGRGLASAIVLAAADWTRSRGADLVFLIADDDDWPKDLYRRLGFDDAFRTWGFTRVIDT